MYGHTNFSKAFDADLNFTVCDVLVCCAICTIHKRVQKILDEADLEVKVYVTHSYNEKMPRLRTQIREHSGENSRAYYT